MFFKAEAISLAFNDLAGIQEPNTDTPKDIANIVKNST
jgi:hypothetical protein